MNRGISKLLLVFAMLLGSVATFAQTSSKDSKRVDDSLTLKFSHNVSQFASDEMSAKIRDFIWTHWLEKRKGVVRASHPTIDTGQLVTRFFIRKDKHGNWGVEERYSKRGYADTVTIYFSVERIEPITDERSPEIPKSITVDSNRDPKNYRLRLKSKNGDEFLL